MPTKFYQIIKNQAGRNPDKPAVIEGDTALSYRNLLESVESFAANLTTLPLTPKSKLGILCVNQKENLIALLGAFLSGVPVVPLSPLLKQDDLVFIVKDASIDIMLINGSFIKPEMVPFFKIFQVLLVTKPYSSSTLASLNAQSFDAFLIQDKKLKPHNRARGIPDMLLYTSGTTARPKGVMLEESQFYANTGAFMKYLGFNPDERCIVALPMFHSFGNIMVLTILRAGGTLVLIPQFQPKAILHKIAEHKASVLPLVPTIYNYFFGAH